jgi:putative effector of murein hydrolase
LFGNTIKYLCGATGICLGTTIKYLRRTTSGAAGHARGTAGNALGTTIKYSSSTRQGHRKEKALNSH